MVTICTTSLTFNNSTFFPHIVFICFVWIWEQTAIISLYNINWVVFITDTQCVYCAVRTGSLTVIQFKFTVLAHAMTHTVTRRPLTLSVDLTLSPHKVPLWQMFVPALQHCHVSISPPVLYSSYLHVAFTCTRHRRSPETFEIEMLFLKFGYRCIAKHFHFC